MSFHPKVDQGCILQAVLAFLETLEEEESILLEAFIPTACVVQPGPSDTNNSPCKGYILVTSHQAHIHTGALGD